MPPESGCATLGGREAPRVAGARKGPMHLHIFRHTESERKYWNQSMVGIEETTHRGQIHRAFPPEVMMLP